jgi:hypothetical protein
MPDADCNIAAQAGGPLLAVDNARARRHSSLTTVPHMKAGSSRGGIGPDNEWGPVEIIK